MTSTRGKGGRGIFSFLKRLFVRFSVFVTITFLILEFVPVVPWAVSRMCGDFNDPDGDVLIVLTADAQSDGLIGFYSYGRAVYAARAWRSGHFRAMVISGGVVNGVSISGSMANFIAASGVPRDRIFLENRSLSTRENALFTKDMIASWPGRKVLLTSDLHMFRARRVFEKIGLHVEPRPFPDVLKHWSSPFERPQLSVSFFWELVKIAGYRVRGWIDLP